MIDGCFHKDAMSGMVELGSMDRRREFTANDPIYKRFAYGN